MIRIRLRLLIIVGCDVSVLGGGFYAGYTPGFYTGYTPGVYLEGYENFKEKYVGYEIVWGRNLGYKMSYPFSYIYFFILVTFYRITSL